MHENFQEECFFIENFTTIRFTKQFNNSLRDYMFQKI